MTCRQRHWAICNKSSVLGFEQPRVVVLSHPNLWYQSELFCSCMVGSCFLPSNKMLSNLSHSPPTPTHAALLSESTLVMIPKLPYPQTPVTSWYSSYTFTVNGVRCVCVGVCVCGCVGGGGVHRTHNSTVSNTLSQCTLLLLQKNRLWESYFLKRVKQERKEKENNFHLM